MKRALNFNAGPAALPAEVLEKAQQEMMNYQDSGMGVMELSHRSKAYEEIHNKAESLLRSLLDIPDNYDVLFLQGGASLQFTMVPMNLLQEGSTAYYILTGSWSEKAYKEATKIGKASIASTGKDGSYKVIPDMTGVDLNDSAAYVHITTNNTIYGTQWQNIPYFKDIPLVADMSSDILSRKIDVSQYGLIYAGAQKNLGPSGVTVAVVRKDLLSRSQDNLPVMLNYRTHSDSRSLYNTPPTLAIYLLKLVLEWAESLGGLDEIERINLLKSNLIYDAIDSSGGFYKGHADPGSRSQMNVTFTLDNEELTANFLSQAKENGFIGLNGHRSVGGCRASIYNAVPLDHVEKLVDFMKVFQSQN
ncbi:3-phosphoserine/phosphohydroxythreonine transaminase [Mesobacillus harenae]|uniref:3-phosphoserine/phosphohydroxythreonine transaminase n=1 Tax=Mesobacillus harenae TaxID=2213203 RepID=UPI001580049A|nr:3-phosphoserine/phosphohydroxythreonine transaminase [Mesobacillus harenae]